ncbi:transposase, partial [Streptomyces sp. NPDC045369]
MGFGRVVGGLVFGGGEVPEPEATIRQVAADWGINPETLRNWVRVAGASRSRGRRAEVLTEPPTPL